MLRFSLTFAYHAVKSDKQKRRSGAKSRMHKMLKKQDKRKSTFSLRCVNNAKILLKKPAPLVHVIMAGRNYVTSVFKKSSRDMIWSKSLKGGEIMKRRTAKGYEYEEVSKILSMWEGTIPNSQIAEDTGRTPGAINVVTTQFESFKNGKAPYYMSDTMKDHFTQFLKNRGRGSSVDNTNGAAAESVRQSVHARASMDEETEALIQKLENAFEIVKNTIPELVALQSKQARAKAEAAVKDELEKLQATNKELMEMAQGSNLASMLRSKLMPDRYQDK